MISENRSWSKLKQDAIEFNIKSKVFNCHNFIDIQGDWEKNMREEHKLIAILNNNLEKLKSALGKNNKKLDLKMLITNFNKNHLF